MLPPYIFIYLLSFIYIYLSLILHLTLVQLLLLSAAVTLSLPLGIHLLGGFVYVEAWRSPPHHAHRHVSRTDDPALRPAHSASWLCMATVYSALP